MIQKLFQIDIKNMKNFSRCKIIAEAGVNHNGSLLEAHKLIDIANISGADYVKFQSFNADELVTSEASKAKYQRLSNKEQSQLDMLKELELPAKGFKELSDHCEELGIKFLSTPFDINSAKNLINYGMEIIKVPSGELTNFPFIKELAKLDLPMIISTGMATINEIEETLKWVKNERISNSLNPDLKNFVTLLHCTSCYPAPIESINLRAISTIRNKFNLDVGYSDHSSGIEVAPIAVAMGATVIEKHFTADKNQTGPDHKASLSPQELSEMIKKIRHTEIIMGNSFKQPTPEEEEIKISSRRSLCLTKDLKKGDKLNINNISPKRPGDGIQPKDFDKVLGKTLNKNKSSGNTLFWKDLV